MSHFSRWRYGVFVFVLSIGIGLAGWCCLSVRAQTEDSEPENFQEPEPKPTQKPKPTPTPKPATTPAQTPSVKSTPTPKPFIIDPVQMEKTHESMLLWQLYYKLLEGRDLSREERALFRRYDNDADKLKQDLYKITPPRAVEESTRPVVRPRPSPAQRADSSWDAVQWCMKHEGLLDVRLPDGRRCDCLTRDYAITMTSGPHWAEALGTALYDAAQTGRKAGMVLVLEQEQEYENFLLLNTTLQHHRLDLKVWVIENYERQQQP